MADIAESSHNRLISRSTGKRRQDDRAPRDARPARRGPGLWVVAAGDAFIGAAAIWGVIETSGSGSAVGGSSMAVVLGSALAAIGALTAACFGIRSMPGTTTILTGPRNAGTQDNGETLDNCATLNGTKTPRSNTIPRAAITAPGKLAQSSSPRETAPAGRLT